MNKVEAGVLYVVATAIGDNEDLSPRAKATLQSVSMIAAEDTRDAGRLLRDLGITTPTTAVHDHNEAERVPMLIERMLAGESLALISDAGTPLISDPGYRVVAAAHEAGIRVSPVPGACAAIAALSAAGLASDRFHFEGFLSAKAGPRESRLQALAQAPHSLIFYEAPHRIIDTLTAMTSAFGEQRLATLARELTKTFETIKRAPLAELLAWVEADSNQQRGEMVIVVAGAPALAVNDQRSITAEALLAVLVRELPVKQAAVIAAEVLGLRKNALYELAQQLREVAR